MNLIFCLQINIKGFKLPKIASLLFLCNILRKNRVMKLVFLRAYKHESLLQIDSIILMQINIKVSTSWYYCFWWKWPDMFKAPKNCRKCFVFYCDAKHSDYLRTPVMCVVTCWLLFLLVSLDCLHSIYIHYY